MMPDSSRSARRGILSRLAAAIFGGYAAANALALALSALCCGLSRPAARASPGAVSCS
jgi:hypothetical protein